MTENSGFRVWVSFFFFFFCHQPVADLNRQEAWSPINCDWAFSCQEQKGTADRKQGTSLVFTPKQAVCMFF